MSSASDKAVEVARPIVATAMRHDGSDDFMERVTSTALAAAHDFALGLDRSVCLRDVVEALDSGEWASYYEGGLHDARDFIEDKFVTSRLDQDEQQ